MNQESVEKITVSELPTGSQKTQTIIRKKAYMSDFFISKTNQIIFALVGILEILLFLRIIFLVLGANRVGIVSFIIGLTQLFVEPFLGIFQSPSTGSSYLDLASIVAIVIYLIFAFIVGLIIDLFSTRTK